ncbi:MAG: hypothetical protein B0D92_02280 [Spirochaeta sp. LUC14_002_19_P3]|nr:MAG: hypothetical protein B0D92_02280 [Spirochaeta sp. LUC14_002_19_P3]
MRLSILIKEFSTMIRFVLVGLGNTGVFTLTAYLLNKAGWHYMAYTAAAYSLGILFSFIMNCIFTFRSFARPLHPMFIRFIILTFSLLGCVQIIQYLLIEKAGLAELVGVIAGMVFYTSCGYTGNRLWVFRNPSKKSSPA